MRAGSLFSGIGGADLGLERAGYCIAWQAESDPWRRAVLRARWPRVPCYLRVEDIADDVAPEPVDLLCVTPPASEPLWLGLLWPILARLRPSFVLIETGLRCADALRTGFGQLGYQGIGINIAAETRRLERIAVRTSRSFAIGRLGTGDGLAELLAETETATGFLLDEVDGGPPPGTMTQVVETLAGLPIGWTCVCGQEPGQCSETSIRLLACNDAIAPALTQWLGTRLLAMRESEVAA